MLKKQKLELVRKWYPNAISTIDGTNEVIKFIEEELELELGQVMFCDSVCSDDVNTIQNPSRAAEFLGPFHMGGLDGFPFVGLTGMGAFAHHIPEGGAAFIYFAPHIGVNKLAEIGKINRMGQNDFSSCCGAAQGALKNLLEGKISEGNITDIDYQFNTIEQILFKEKDRILSAETPIFEATEVIYGAIEKRIYELVKQTKFSCKYVILYGGILINGDTEMGSFLENRKFEVIEIQ